MLDKIITEISKNFINEAISSPNLLSDMAAMEKYMSESYSGRIFIELLQNADDCCSKKVYVERFADDIIFANDGKPFDENDVLAISRSGASSKTRGKNIGYRGIGFKSTLYLTNEIIIYSDDTFFTFNKNICSQKLGLDANNLPIIRIPILLDFQDIRLYRKVLSLKNEGYNTIFIFKNAEIETFLEDISNVSEGDFIFLNNVEKCEITIDTYRFQVNLNRKYENDKQLISFETGDKGSWLVVKQNDVSLGFKYDIGMRKIIPCSEKEQVYHSYLPTLDKVCFPLKINADFSTDPSRKHIIIDAKTTEVLENISVVLSNIIKFALSNKLSNRFSNIFDMLGSSNNFSKCNNLLKQKLQNNIVSIVDAPSNLGKYINISEYRLLPSWLEESEKFFIRTHSDIIKGFSYNIRIYETFDKVDEFIGNYSSCQFEIKDIVEFMKEEYLVQKMSSNTQGKIWSKIIKSEFFSQKVHETEIDLSDMKILTDTGITSLKEISTNKLSIEPDVQNAINDNTSSSDLEWFSRKYQINMKSDKTVILTKPTKTMEIEIKPHISKWRSAEQQCIEIEKFFGNNATDVSKKNIGYDIESITPTGNIRRIEVKSIIDKGGFSITNNEYTAAHQYGNEYFLCLIFQNDNNIKLTYIQNPLQSIKFEKRIRQWEWFCEEYGGESYTFDL